MRPHFLLAAWCFSYCLLTAGCQPTTISGPRCLEPPPHKGLVLARVADATITSDQIRDRIKAQGENRKQYENSQAVRELVDDQIRFELLVRTALDRGLARDPDVIDAARKIMVRKLLQRDLDPAVYEDMAGDDALRSFYERHKDNYLQPEKRRFGHIQLAATEEGRAVAQSIIDLLKRRPNDSEQWSAAVSRYSVDPDSRGHNGEYPFQTRDDITEAFGQSFAATLFSLEPGAIAPQPVASTRGWHVVKMVARRDALTRDFVEVRDQIREKLLQGQRSKQFQQYLQEIRQNYPVTVYQDRLQSFLSDASKSP